MNTRVLLESIGGIIALVVLVVLIMYFASVVGLKPAVIANTPPVASSTLATHPASPPPLTAEEKHIVATSKGASYLISYTDRGFVPATATIKKGDTVRFFNASSEQLWIAATGASGHVYPGPGTCGQSAFDMCETIAPQHFWEFTFDSAGTWSYQNNANTAKNGVVVVR